MASSKFWGCHNTLQNYPELPIACTGKHLLNLIWFMNVFACLGPRVASLHCWEVSLSYSPILAVSGNSLWHVFFYAQAMWTHRQWPLWYKCQLALPVNKNIIFNRYFICLQFKYTDRKKLKNVRLQLTLFASSCYQGLDQLCCHLQY